MIPNSQGTYFNCLIFPVKMPIALLGCLSHLKSLVAIVFAFSYLRFKQCHPLVTKYKKIT